MKISKFYGYRIFVFLVEISKFYENEVTHDKNRFKRGLSVAFKSKMREITGKIGWSFCSLTFPMSKLPNYLQICLDIS